MKLATVLIGLLFINSSLGQKVILSTGKYEARWPMENNFSFSAGNTPCNSIVFKTNNGEIIQQGCNLYYTPDTLKKTFFIVYKKINGKLSQIDSVSILIYMNYPRIQIGVKTSGELTKNELAVMGGLLVKLFVTEDHSAPMEVNSFRVIAIRGDTVESNINIGPRYSAETLALINKLNPKDRILFTEIKTTILGRREIYATPTEFIIK